MKTKQQKEALVAGIVLAILAVLLLFALFQGGCGCKWKNEIPAEVKADTVAMLMAEYHRAKFALIEAAVHQLSPDYSRALQAQDSIFNELIRDYKIRDFLRVEAKACKAVRYMNQHERDFTGTLTLHFRGGDTMVETGYSGGFIDSIVHYFRSDGMIQADRYHNGILVNQELR